MAAGGAIDVAKRPGPTRGDVAETCQTRALWCRHPARSVTVRSQPERGASVHPSPMRHTGHMLALVLGMLVCLVGGMVVMGFVAAQARRDGRDVLTARGEEVVGRVTTKR